MGKFKYVDFQEYLVNIISNILYSKDSQYKFCLQQPITFRFTFFTENNKSFY